MAKVNDSVLLREKLLDFIAEPDPLLCMLEWITARLMRIEADTKVGAAKGKRDKGRTTDFSGRAVLRPSCFTHLMEYAEDWSTSRCYLSPVSLAEFLAQVKLAA